MSRYLGLLLFSVMVMGGAANALACSCSSPSDLSTEEADARARELDLFAEAEVTGFHSREQCYPEKDGTPFCVVEVVADFSIITPYKGTVGETAEIQLGPTNVVSSCGPFFEAGQKLLLSAYFIAETQRDNSFITPAGYSTGDCTLFHSALDPIRRAFDRYRGKWQAMEARVAAPGADAEDWRSLGKFLEEWRDYPHALDAYERAAKLYPDDVEIQAARGRMLFVLHRPAWQALDRAVALGDTKSKSLLALENTASANAAETSHLDLSNLDLRYKSFVDLTLSGSDFRGSDLTFARFINVRLSGADFRGADLGGAVMQGVVLRNADLSNAQIGHLKLDAKNLSGTKFSGVDLRLWEFDRPKVPDASILNANLAGANIDCDSGQSDLARQIATQQPAANFTDRCRAAAGLLAK